VTSVAQTFQSITEAVGLHAAMRWLNSRVPYRFTAIFAFDGDMLRNICFVDKDDPNVTNCIDQPISNSYCTYIHQSRRTFSVEQASTDARVADHPKRESYQCYYGVPLFDANRKMLGTVCHFDSLPQSVTEDVAATLDDLAPIIAEAAFEKK
jgi:GAF domain-containing protein